MDQKKTFYASCASINGKNHQPDAALRSALLWNEPRGLAGGGDDSPAGAHWTDIWAPAGIRSFLM